MFGIALGWASPSAPRLFSDSNSFPVTTTEFAWIVSIMPLGATLACLFAGLLRNKFGTKFTVVLIGIPTSAGWLLILFAQNSAMVKNICVITSNSINEVIFSSWLEDF